MKVLAWTCWVAVALAGAVGVAAESAPRPADAAGGPTTQPVNRKTEAKADELQIEPMDPASVPITLPAMVKASGGSRPPLLPSGVMIINRICSIEKDPTGKWRTIKDPRVGKLYLLPCELLETVEKIRADDPAKRFNLSGEVHRYRGGYYMLLRRALLVSKSSPPQVPEPPKRAAGQAASAPAAPAPTTPKPPAATTTTTRPAEPKEASADDVARELLRQTPGKPVVPVVVKPSDTPTPPAPSGAPVGPTLQPGPGTTAIHRLVRLLPRAIGQQWSRLAFEADNTLREPPMRVLPNLHLERMENLSGGGRALGTIFHISGEVYVYRGVRYLLLRAAMKKRDLDQF